VAVFSIAFHIDGLVKFPKNQGYFEIESMIGEECGSNITGASEEATRVRQLGIPVESKRAYGFE
jgi:hypothetical protein